MAICASQSVRLREGSTINLRLPNDDPAHPLPVFPHLIECHRRRLTTIPSHLVPTQQQRGVDMKRPKRLSSANEHASADEVTKQQINRALDAFDRLMRNRDAHAAVLVALFACLSADEAQGDKIVDVIRLFYTTGYVDGVGDDGDRAQAALH
jgi:hypothetical protein